ncbi:MAG: hypothetical protein Q9197_003385 [Variospora fuerteventurae]
MATSLAIEPFSMILQSFILSASVLLLVFSAVLFIVYVIFGSHKVFSRLDHLLGYCTFFYSSFLKPHSEDNGSGQQAALESFYKVQANVYDATRKRLLCGREDMLALAAAQLKFQAKQGLWNGSRPIWVDVSQYAEFSRVDRTRLIVIGAI